MSARKTETSPTHVARDVLVSNKLGIHARPAAMFVRLANQYRCDILVEKDGETVNVTGSFDSSTASAVARFEVICTNRVAVVEIRHIPLHIYEHHT